MALAAGGGGYAVWLSVRERVLTGDAYRLRPENVVVTPLPPWIKTDVRSEALRDASLDNGPSILERDLAERVALAFAAHPWVAEVTRATKEHPARVVVELVYRRPACMVELPRVPELVAGGLYPVDVQGVLLPSADFSPAEAAEYPRLAGIETFPVADAGRAWGDDWVAAGASLAAVLADDWRTLGLAQIAPARELADSSEARPLVVTTHGGVRIVWGRSPIDDAEGEPTAAEKLTRLKQLASDQMGLDALDAPREIDVRRAADDAPRTARQED
jgi:hypothetical protein